MSHDATERSPQPGLPPEQLQRWAEKRHVDHWLRISAKRFLGWEYWRFPGFPEVATLEELITYRPGRLSPATLSLVERVQQGALRFLQDKVAEASEGIRGEQRWLADLVPPRDPAVRRAYDLLLACRRDLRVHCAPRPRREWSPEHVKFVSEPPALLLRERVDAICGDNGEPQVRVALDEDDAGVRVSCSCRSRPAGCSVRLAAVDAALDILSGRSHHALWIDVAATLAMPRWERVLSAVDATLDDEARAATLDDQPASLGWLIGEVYRGGRCLPKVEPLLCRLKMRGDGFRSKKLRWEDLHAKRSACVGEADRQVLSLFCPGPSIAPFQSSRGHYARSYHAVAALAGHPLLFLRDEAGKRAHVAVRRVDFSLAVDGVDDGGAALSVILGSLRLSLVDAADLLEQRSSDDLLIHADMAAKVCYVAPVDARLESVLRSLLPRGARLPEEALPALIQLFPRLSEVVPLVISEELRGPERAGSTRPLFRLSLDESGALTVQLLVRPCAGAPAQRPAEGPLTLYRFDDGEVTAVRRDLEQERLSVEAMACAVGLRDDQQQQRFLWAIADRDEALGMLGVLQELEDQNDVEWGAGGRHRLTRAATTQDLRVEVSGRRDWFNLKGSLSVDGADVPLGDLLAAVRDKRRFINVKGNLWVRISKQLETHLAAAANLVSTSHGELRLSPLAAPLIDELSRDGAELHSDDTWRQLLLRMKAADEGASRLPQGLTATLRGYQTVGYRWMERLSRWCPGGCLADDMGLGKTVQALALLCERAAQGPALVVAPTSVGHNWTREAARFAPGLRTMLFRGSAQLDQLAGSAAGDVVVTSYTLLASNIETFARKRFATLVLDEAQSIKNASTQRARAILKLDAGFRLALTGTPLENRCGELWSLFRAIIPGLLGSQSQFRNRFAAPIEKHDDPEARALLARLIQPFILRRLKSEVAPELPPRTEVRVDVSLSPAERRLYERVRGAAVRELGGEGNGQHAPDRRFELLAAMTRLRQLACHPRLVDPSSSVPSSKLEVLCELLESLRAEGHRALVFSQFTSFLALVREALDRRAFQYRYLDGSTPETRRREEIDAFQRGDGDLFLLSLKAGGFGLNLTAADYVIHLDPWWNPAVEDQATDRAHRIGQERPVTVYRLVAEETIESAILDLHAEKRELVSGLLAGTGSASRLSTDELLTLMLQGVGG